MKDSDYDAAIQTWGERVAAHQNVQVPPNAVFTLEFYSQSGGCDTCGYGGGDDRYELEMKQWVGNYQEVLVYAVGDDFGRRAIYRGDRSIIEQRIGDTKWEDA